MNRHHQARRSNSNIAPKLEPGPAPIIHPNPSPQSRPTPPSHHSSPTSNSPGFPIQGVMTPPASDSQMQQMQRVHQQLKPQPQHGMTLPQAGVLGPALISGGKGQGGSGPGSTGGVAAMYYPAPFQNHIEQLGKLTRPLLSFSFNRAMFVLD